MTDSKYFTTTKKGKSHYMQLLIIFTHIYIYIYNKGNVKEIQIPEFMGSVCSHFDFLGEIWLSLSTSSINSTENQILTDPKSNVDVMLSILKILIFFLEQNFLSIWAFFL